jgi:hypothetical protein
VVSNDLTDAQYAAYIDRILECRKAEDVAKEDTKAVYAALADAGGDKTEAGLLVRALRMDEKDAGKAKAREEMLEEARLRYRRGKASHVRAREATQSYAEAKGRDATTPKASNSKTSSVFISAFTTTPSELTQTQEQPETSPASQSGLTGEVRTEAGGQSDAGTPSQFSDAPLESVSDEISSEFTPSPAVSPQPAIADDEAAQAQTSSAPIADPHSSQVEDGQPQPSANVPSAGRSGFEPGHSIDEFVQQQAGDPQDGNEPVSGEPASVAQFDNPRCQNPDGCTFAHSRNSCWECTMAWAKRPKAEQVLLWQEAMEAAESEVA